MRDFENDRGNGSGGGGWSIRITLDCHKCGKQEDQDIVQAKWLQPIHVWQKDGSWLQTQLCPTCAKWRFLYWLKVVWRLRIGRISNIFAPGYSHCGRCLTNWHFVEGHSTQVGNGGGMFPLCEQCWSELRPQERLPYYRALYESWDEPSETFTWPQIEAAVLNERAEP